MTGSAGAGLRVEGVSVALGGRTAVADAALTALPASLTALVGPNGAGKSTLLRAIAGVPLPDSGRITLEGTDLGALRRRERARRIALVEQDAATELPLTVEAVVGLGRTPHGRLLGFGPLGSRGDHGAAPEVEFAIAAAGIGHLRGRDVSRLSGGERQRVLLGRALAQHPGLLLLDEPTNHLDVAAQLELLGLLRRLTAEGVIVVAALHDLTLAAAHADRVVVLSAGRVVAEGAPRATLTPELLAEVYRVRASWTTNPLTGAPLLATAPLP